MSFQPFGRRLKAASKAFRSKPNRFAEVTVATAGDLAAAAYRADRNGLVLTVPTAFLRMSGGYAYGPGHPMVQAVEAGPGPLQRFYDTVRPRTIVEQFDLSDMDGETGADRIAGHMPWFADRAAYAAGPPGYRFFGPMPAGTAEAEYARLVRIERSVRRIGYRPDIHSHISGSILCAGSKVAFIVLGGKHRAAILAHRGDTTVPVTFHPRYPRLLDTAQIDIWPTIRQGLMTKRLARAVAGAFVAGRHFDG
ncbi:MAG: hypothetical protein AAF264_09460 [Pseudomonadota bacterium]